MLSQIPSQEDELGALLATPPPRLVPPRLARAAKAQPAAGFGMIFGGAILGLGLMLLLGVVISPPSDLRLFFGDTTVSTCRITNVRQERTAKQGSVWRYRFDYDAKGSRRQGTSYADQPNWKEGERVAIRYLDADTRIASMLEARSERDDVWALFLLPLMGGVTLCLFWLPRRKALWLLRHGQLAQASIEALGRVKRSRDKNRHVLRLRLKLPDGERPVDFESSVGAFVSLAEARRSSGQPVNVLNDPRKPSRVLLPEALR